MPCDKLKEMVCPKDAECVTVTGDEIKSRAVEPPFEFSQETPDEDE